MPTVDALTDLANAKTALSSASAPGVGFSLRRTRLEKAMLSFNKAFDEIPSAESAARIEAGQGLISASTLLLELYAGQGISSVSFVDAKYIAGLIFDALARAFREGAAGQPVLSHSNRIVETFGELLQADITRLNREGKQSYFRWIHESCLRAPRPVRESFKLVAFNASVDLGEEIFYEALLDFEKGRWAKALSTIKSYESAMVVAVEHEEKLEIADKRAVYLFDNFSLLFARCQGSQLLKTGDVHWDRAAGGDPGDLWGNALLAQDDYRLALSFVAEKDLELEGTVLTRLARLFVQVAKLPTVAHQLYLRAVQLGVLSQPRGTWYEEATAAVQKHRDDLWAAEQKEWTEKRKPIVEKLKPELDRLEEKIQKKTSDWELAEFIWKEWPPKTEGPKELPGTELSEKKRFLKVIQRYHSDKNLASVYGDEWAVMAEEISKALGTCYNIIKGAD